MDLTEIGRRGFDVEAGSVLDSFAQVRVALHAQTGEEGDGCHGFLGEAVGGGEADGGDALAEIHLVAGSMKEVSTAV